MDAQLERRTVLPKILCGYSGTEPPKSITSHGSLRGLGKSGSSPALPQTEREFTMIDSSNKPVRFAVIARTATTEARSSSITDQTNECTSRAAKANPNRRGQHARVINGLSARGRYYGYSTIPAYSSDGAAVQGSKLVVCEPEAAAIRRIYREFAAGASASKIAKALSAEQVPIPRAKRVQFPRWTPRNVYAVLHQPRYRGNLVWGLTEVIRDPESGSMTRLKRHLGAAIQVAAPELKIVDDCVASAVDARLAAMDRCPKSGV